MIGGRERGSTGEQSGSLPVRPRSHVHGRRVALRHGMDPTPQLILGIFMSVNVLLTARCNRNTSFHVLS